MSAELYHWSTLEPQQITTDHVNVNIGQCTVYSGSVTMKDSQEDPQPQSPLLKLKNDKLQDLDESDETEPGSFKVQLRDLTEKVFSRRFVNQRLPILTWITTYTLEMLVCDMIAGVTTALTVIPQGIGYAPLAGLPLQYGLYASIVPGFVYCLLGTTRQATVGPTGHRTESLRNSIYLYIYINI